MCLYRFWRRYKHKADFELLLTGGEGEGGRKQPVSLAAVRKYAHLLEHRAEDAKQVWIPQKLFFL